MTFHAKALRQMLGVFSYVLESEGERSGVR
jgi:hypothetical protein